MTLWSRTLNSLLLKLPWTFKMEGDLEQHRRRPQPPPLLSHHRDRGPRQHEASMAFTDGYQMFPFYYVVNTPVADAFRELQPQSWEPLGSNSAPIGSTLTCSRSAELGHFLCT